MLSGIPSPFRSPVLPAPALSGVFQPKVRKSGKPFFSRCALAARDTAKSSLMCLIMPPLAR